MTKMLTKTNKRQLLAFALVTILMISIAGLTIAYLNSNLASQPSDSQPKAKPMFSFSGADGWRQGPSNQTSMALFGPSRKDGTSACFTSIEFKPGRVDIKLKLAEHAKSLAKSGGSSTEIAKTTNRLTMIGTAVRYQFHQFRLSGVDNIKQGLGLGYIQLANGHVEVMASCDKAQEITATIPALQAYKFNPSA